MRIFSECSAPSIPKPLPPYCEPNSASFFTHSGAHWNKKLQTVPNLGKFEFLRQN